MVSALAADSKGRIFAFQRKEPPVVIFDREGNLLESWGNGSFEFAHGIHIANDIVYVTDRNTSVCIMYTLDGKPIQMLGRHGVHSDTGCENPGDLVPRAAGPFNYPAELVPSPSGIYTGPDGYRNSRFIDSQRTAILRNRGVFLVKMHPMSSTFRIAFWLMATTSLSATEKTTVSRSLDWTAILKRYGTTSTVRWTFLWTRTVITWSAKARKTELRPESASWTKKVPSSPGGSVEGLATAAG
ncbi:MAG: hypothetical protein Ct9H300mP11_24580 [Chloroflexota bacterium]|nr:MAG: hypothetical protein Ct9H300mP11_24580 [Chloroflexota bacterium]